MFSFPKIKYVDTNNTGKQFLHLLSEVWELVRAYVRWKITGNKLEFHRELFDVWQSAESLVRVEMKLGYNMNEVYTETYMKNARRGYYDIEGGDL